MLLMLLSLYLLRYTKYTKYIPNLPTLSVFSTDGQPSSHSASATNPEDSFDIQLWEQIARANANHAVRNEHIFGPLTDQNLVIVVQVHNRVNYLRALINSMVKVRHIEETLVVFSHDFFDDQINKLVTGVNFTKVINIFGILYSYHKLRLSNNGPSNAFRWFKYFIPSLRKFGSKPFRGHRQTTVHGILIKKRKFVTRNFYEVNLN